MKQNINKTIYIAGKMRGVPYYNFPAFDKAKPYLFNTGYGRVISPADLDRVHDDFDALKLPADTDWNAIPPNFDFDACIERDIQAVKECDAIYMLKGWEDSKGARAEKALAEWLGKEVMYEEPDISVPAFSKEFGEALHGIVTKDLNPIRTFDSGATRNSLDGKLQYSRFLDPEVFKVYCEYMQSHRIQLDGSMRDPDNWKKGISQDVYMDSLYRHVTNLWGVYNGYERVQPETGEPETKKELLCAIMFNVIGYMFELNKEEKENE
jgi:hypothetical protein